MKIAFKKTLYVAIVVTNLAYAESQKSNCEINEEIFFSCSTGKKYISFCASPKGVHPVFLEYRFGRPGKFELTHKVIEGGTSEKFSRAEVLGASSASTEIWFENNATNYVLGDPVKGNVTLEVVNQGKIIAKLVCKKDFLGNSSTASDLIDNKDYKDFLKIYSGK